MPVRSGFVVPDAIGRSTQFEHVSSALPGHHALEVCTLNSGHFAASIGRVIMSSLF